MNAEARNCELGRKQLIERVCFCFACRSGHVDCCHCERLGICGIHCKTSEPLPSRPRCTLCATSKVCSIWSSRRMRYSNISHRLPYGYVENTQTPCHRHAAHVRPFLSRSHCVCESETSHWITEIHSTVVWPASRVYKFARASAEALSFSSAFGVIDSKAILAEPETNTGTFCYRSLIVQSVFYHSFEYFLWIVVVALPHENFVWTLISGNCALIQSMVSQKTFWWFSTQLTLIRLRWSTNTWHSAKSKNTLDRLKNNKTFGATCTKKGDQPIGNIVDL